MMSNSTSPLLLCCFQCHGTELFDARVEPSHGFNMFSAQEEVQAGQQAAAQVSKQLPVLPDSDPVTIYVQRLGQQLAAHAPGEKWPYTFHVVNQKEINAFALPGGPVFVNLGTIQAADNEAELAGVIAHEISHVVQRHGTRAASRQMAAQLPLAFLGGSWVGARSRRWRRWDTRFGVGSYFLRNSRKAESEADLLGTDIMYDSVLIRAPCRISLPSWKKRVEWRAGHSFSATIPILEIARKRWLLKLAPCRGRRLTAPTVPSFSM